MKYGIHQLNVKICENGFIYFEMVVVTSKKSQTLRIKQMNNKSRDTEIISDNWVSYMFLIEIQTLNYFIKK